MLWIGIIIGIFSFEYFMKKHMDDMLPFRVQRPLFGGRVILKKHYNTGTAGNFFSACPKAVQHIHAAVLGLAAGALAAALLMKRAAAAKTGLSFLVGGGLSNLYDRIAKGHVIDYVSFGIGPERFRRLVFNTADFFIFAGAVLCSAAALFSKSRKH